MAALATIEDALARLDREPSELTPADVDQLLLRLDDASDFIRAATGGQTLDQVVDDAVILQASGRRVLQLPQIPVTAVTAVAVDGAAYIENTHYRWAPDGTLVRLGCCWPLGPVAVTYSHGYATIPDDLRRLCARIAADMWSGLTQVRSESVGSYSVTYLRSSTGDTVLLTDDDVRVLSKYSLGVGP